jgi:hypothetical protein
VGSQHAAKSESVVYRVIHIYIYIYIIYGRRGCGRNQTPVQNMPLIVQTHHVCQIIASFVVANSSCAYAKLCNAQLMLSMLNDGLVWQYCEPIQQRVFWGIKRWKLHQPLIFSKIISLHFQQSYQLLISSWESIWRRRRAAECVHGWQLTWIPKSKTHCMKWIVKLIVNLQYWLPTWFRIWILQVFAVTGLGCIVRVLTDRHRV